MAEEEKGEIPLAKKKVDESWKSDIKKEKEKLKDSGEKPSKEREMPEADFRSFVTGLIMQGLMFMGEIPDPVSRKKTRNLPQAKYMIDILMMLREKTAGNLIGEEQEILEGALHELQMKFVKMSEQV